MALEDYLHKLVIGLVGQRGEVLERRAVIQLVIIHNPVVGILVHQEIDSVRATVERKGNVSVQSACYNP